MSEQGQEFISQQGGRLTNSVKGLIFRNTSLVTHLNQHSSQQKCVIIFIYCFMFGLLWACNKRCIIPHIFYNHADE